MSAKYTDQEIEYLKSNYNEESVSDIASHLDRSEDAVQMKASRLGLTEDRGHNGDRSYMSLNFSNISNYREYVEKQEYGNEELCWFISGLVTAEGCFTEYETDGRFRAEFKIGMADRDENTLKNIASFFNRSGCISRREEQKDHHADTIHFRINSIKDIIELIIPFFEQYPPRGKKYNQYVEWREEILEKYNFSLFNTISTSSPTST